ncbi:hypothetical protein IMSHALPRED_010617 [Imshaugia aleurites]|uniref:F-box domain-containing protein n=1 Tax=Imshaugia aleurites TaxID=172621 RepID=A0A8H3IB65_9LECA|nr:hypothetical protein IMSHALPRED_010617 [Imshaugia aleurites]
MSPPEILLIILRGVEATSHFNVKLVCRAFHRYASVIDTKTLTFAQATKCHAPIEAAMEPRIALVCCCCTRCGRVKDTSQFADRQAVRAKLDRTCVACGLQRKKYSAKVLPSIGREERIPCYDYLQPRPTYAGWRLKSAEAVIMLPVTSGKIYCEYCVETRLRFVTITSIYTA